MKKPLTTRERAKQAWLKFVRSTNDRPVTVLVDAWYMHRDNPRISHWEKAVKILRQIQREERGKK